MREFNLTEEFNPVWDYVVEMVAIDYPILNNTHHFIALHGTHAGDREKPHIHIYLENDKHPFNQFNFEIALDELLCYDELNLIRMSDKKKNINITNRSKCSWNGYTKLKNDFEDWLYSNKVNKRGEYIDNLDACIYFYNQESGNSEANPLLKYIKEHGMKVLNKYKKYFNIEDINNYKECFEDE